MCGIAGRVNAEELKSVDCQRLRAATRMMNHRGPDGEGYFCEKNVGLGHRRLSIVDLAGGAQPLPNEDKTLWVTFNGEIYNHLALRAELEALGHEFRTRSDTEVLVHGYEAWGEGLPSRLRGMFAFAIWDGRAKRLFMARDRLGIKPVYWTRVGRDLVFASEIKALFAFPDVTRSVDEARLPEYLALRYVPGPQTMFQSIERLQPGHTLSFAQGELRMAPFWDVPVHASGSDERVDEAEATERFRELFQEAVKIRLMGEVPVGLFLSGGIDSTAVAWALAQENPAALKSFAVGYEGDAEGELAFARSAAHALGTQHREVLINSDHFRDSMQELVWHLDEPLSDGACIPLMHLAKRAREEVVIVLSGEGADELLGGYGIYQKMLTLEKIQAAGGSLVRGAAELGLSVARGPKVRKYLAMGGKPTEARYFGVGRGFGDELVTECFGAGALEAIAARFAPRWERSAGAPSLHRLLYTDTKVWLPDDLLIKADKMTMAWAVELRVPFLDHVLLEQAWRLPPSLKMRGNTTKVLLRKAMEGRIPKNILHRPKKGFPVPIGRWLRTSLYEACRERLLATRSSVRPLLGTRVLERLLDEHQQGRVDRTEELYTLWVYEEWHQRFFAEAGVFSAAGPKPLKEIPRSPGSWTPPTPSPLSTLRA